MTENNKGVKSPGDIPMGRTAKYTEKVDEELLGTAPSMLPFCSILTDYDDLTILGRKAAKKKKRKQRKSRRSSHAKLRRTAAVLFTVIILLVSFAAGECFYIFKNYTPVPTKMFSSSGSENAHVRGTDVLFIFDFNDEGTKENDAHCLMLVSHEPFAAGMKLTVFPQDCVLTLADGEETTVASLFFNKKYDLAARAACRNAGVAPCGYVKISESDFSYFVDGLGGLPLPSPDLTVTESLREEGFTVPQGRPITASGPLACAYCRIIKGQNEAFRAERQLETVGQILKKIKFTNPAELLKRSREVLSGTVSDLTKAEFFRFALNVAFRTVLKTETEIYTPAAETLTAEDIS